MILPSINTPNTSVSNGSKLGISTSGSLKVSPSSPPVHSDSCEASVWNAAATASVIIAKKIARTRSENSPIASDSKVDSTSAPTTPAAMAPHVGPMRVVAMAMPYAPMPKNIVCAKLTMPV